MPPKKKPAKKPTTRWKGMTPLEVHAIQIHEFYKALRSAGFPTDVAMTLSTDPTAQPHWFQKIPGMQIEDDED